MKTIRFNETKEMTMKCKSSRNATWCGKFLALGAVILTASMALAQSKVSPDLQADMKRSSAGTSGHASSLNVIVQYKAAPRKVNYAMAASAGAKLLAQFPSLNMAVYTIRLSAVNQFASSDPQISYITPDRVLTNATDYGNGAVAIGLDIAPSVSFDGTGIAVAVIDSGISSSHDDLKVANSSSSRVVYSQNFVPGTTSTADAYGHGTHVAGIIAGNGHDSTCPNCTVTFRGIAPNVKLVNLRVLDQNGQGNDSSVIAAIERTIALQGTYNIRVINLSLGRGIYESYTQDPLCQAVEAAWKAGIVVAVAAGNFGRDNSLGNHGYGTITSPANDPYVITVGAMNTMATDTPADDEITTYSSKGPTAVDHIVKPDLVAPGNNRISLLASPAATLYAQNAVTAVPKSYYQSGAPSSASSDYYRLSGTSMAAPEVSGAVALMLQQNKSLAPDQVKARLMKTASKSFPVSSSITVSGVAYTEYYDVFTVGAGYLNIAAALSSTDLAPATAGSALSPIASYNPTTGTVTLTDQGSAVIWGGSVLWGTSVVWGTLVGSNSVLWGTSVNLNGNSVLWGTNAAAQSVIWGSSVLWGAITAHGDN